MSDNVVELPQPVEHVWVCTCGCETHYVHPDWIECASCGTTTQDAGGWSFAQTSPSEANRMAVADGPADFTYQSMSRAVLDGGVIGAVVFYQDGRVRTVLDGVETPEQIEWWNSRVDDLREQIKREPPISGD